MGGDEEAEGGWREDSLVRREGESVLPLPRGPSLYLSLSRIPRLLSRRN